jgi:hypothetical protein
MRSCGAHGGFVALEDGFLYPRYECGHRRASLADCELTLGAGRDGRKLLRHHGSRRARQGFINYSPEPGHKCLMLFRFFKRSCDQRDRLHKSLIMLQLL